MNELTQTFEGIKQIDDQGNEFWSARELSKLLDYAEYRNFQPVIEKAKQACEKWGSLFQTISLSSTRWSK